MVNEEMKLYSSERTALFIDGPNFYEAVRNHDISIDYKKLRGLFADSTRLVRALYYTALEEDQEFCRIRPLVDWLDYNGYTLITKPTKEIFDQNGRRRLKGNMDVEITVDMMSMAPHIDHAILFSGNGNFRRLIKAVQSIGIRTSIVSTLESSPPLIADSLRRQADNFIELADLADKISREGPPPSARNMDRNKDRDKDAEGDGNDDDGEYEYEDGYEYEDDRV